MSMIWLKHYFGTFEKHSKINWTSVTLCRTWFGLLIVFIGDNINRCSFIYLSGLAKFRDGQVLKMNFSLKWSSSISN